MHRDLKTLNLLLASKITNKKDFVHVKIADFGVSRPVSNPDLVTRNIGTMFWMAP